eukprot:jgi/Phyca11/18436/fgenesh1_pg.PHYCAscaffold_36_\
MEIDLTYDSDSDIVPSAIPADAGGAATDPARDLPYRLFNTDELDIDYFEVNGPCFALLYLNKPTFGFRTTAKNFNDMLLVAQGPGYVYVPKHFKDAIIIQLCLHFEYPMEAHDDERALLKWLSGMDLAMRLMAAGVERVTYVDYAMKGKLKNFFWIDDLFRDIPEATVVVDVAAMTKPSTAGRVQLVRWMRSRPEGYTGATHELNAEKNAVSPSQQRVLLIAFTEQQVDMGDTRTEIRFQIWSFAEITGVFSRQFAKNV